MKMWGPLFKSASESSDDDNRNQTRALLHTETGYSR